MCKFGAVDRVEQFGAIDRVSRKFCFAFSLLHRFYELSKLPFDWSRRLANLDAAISSIDV
jgi:hypothetical protein